MDSKLHIIVTSEHGAVSSFLISKILLKRSLVFLATLVLITSVASVRYFIESQNLQSQVETLTGSVTALSSEKTMLTSQVSDLEEKNKAQLVGVYGELSQRSQVIDSILNTLNIVPPPAGNSKRNSGGPAPTKTSPNSGGPFSSISGEACDDLITRADKEIDIIRPIPLGFPVTADRISSFYGRRIDPINNKIGFHGGIDLSAHPGTKVRATADGIVAERGRNSTYGWYIKINHGNKFITLYAHNKKIIAKKGARVTRGQVIALVGNTGRTTGPHLHYEIRYKDSTVNPLKFMNITKLISTEAG